jgi:hypothetical protein
MSIYTFYTNSIADLSQSFIPWLHARSIRKVGIREKSSVFLDEIIQAVVDKREAEVADGIWREISDQDKQLSPEDEEEYPGEYYKNMRSVAGE